LSDVKPKYEHDPCEKNVNKEPPQATLLDAAGRKARPQHASAAHRATAGA